MNRSKKVFIIALVLGFIFLVGCGGSEKNDLETTNNQDVETTINQKDDLKQELFVDVSWLKDNIETVIILDARGNEQYEAGHIPGAVNAPWKSFAKVDGNPGAPGWGVLLPKDEIATKLSALGINGDKPIIVYADPNGWGEDGRILWMLKMAGVENAKMLDGGWVAWTNSDNELCQDTHENEAVNFQIKGLDDSMTVTTDYIKSNINNIKIVDSRSKKEYDGATEFGEKRGGHLPNAILIPFKEVFNDDGTVKSVPELKVLFEEAGLEPDDEIVTYCTAGIRSAHMALLMKLAGFENAKNYDASFYEWAGDDSLTILK